MDAGLCTAQIGIADTGSLALCSEAERHRLVSLVPPSSIIVLFERDLVPDFAAALQRFEENGLPTTLSFITGPSRTADIELTLTVGVHGPASVDVILIREADSASA
jgi:L-lactate dehydrogenase complex protein LldG